MDFELTLPIAGIEGHAASELVAELAGELTQADLDELTGAPPLPTHKPLARLAERHRAMARAMAGGARPIDVAALFGVSTQTIDRLQKDPAFQALTAFYQRSDDEVFRSTQDRLTEVTHSALDLIEERLEDDETRKKVTIPQALAIASMGADRTGNGPQSTSVAVNINANLADRMKAARERARETMRDITPREAAE